MLARNKLQKGQQNTKPSAVSWETFILCSSVVASLFSSFISSLISFLNWCFTIRVQKTTIWQGRNNLQESAHSLFLNVPCCTFVFCTPGQSYHKEPSATSPWNVTRVFQFAAAAPSLTTGRPKPWPVHQQPARVSRKWSYTSLYSGGAPGSWKKHFCGNSRHAWRTVSSETKCQSANILWPISLAWDRSMPS